MELLLNFLSALGPAGLLFIVVIGLFHLGLTEFFKMLVRTFQQRSRRSINAERGRRGQAPLDDTLHPPSEFGGLAVVALSLALGALLGGVMLSAVAPIIGIRPGPWAGVIAGVLLAAVVSGLVHYQQRRVEKRAELLTQGQAAQSDALAEVLTLLAGARGTPFPVRDDAPLAPQPPALRPASGRDVRATQWGQDEGF